MADTTLTADAALDAERGYLGCVLNLPLPAARRLLAEMRADDFGSPLAELVAQLVIEIVAAGHPPAPVAVYTHAAHTGRATTEAELQRLTGWLIDTYQLPTWPGLGNYLKAAVLEAAWRRAVREHAHRLLQATDHSPTEVVRELADDTDRIAELWTRYQQAIGPEHAEWEVAA